MLMVAFIVLVACLFNFLCLSWWARCTLDKEYGFAKSGPPQSSKLLEIVSGILLVSWGVLLIGIAFWGLTDNPYLEGGGKPWLRAGDEYAIYVMLILAVAVGLSYYLTYRFGEANGAKGMKKIIDSRFTGTLSAEPKRSPKREVREPPQ
jgi:hypothetical protein